MRLLLSLALVLPLLACTGLFGSGNDDNNRKKDSRPCLVGCEESDADADSDSDSDSDADADADSDSDSDADTDGDPDADGDHWSASEDCDDHDADVNPGRDEDCETSEDDDCDGDVNEGCVDTGPLAYGYAHMKFETDSPGRATALSATFSYTLEHAHNDVCAIVFEASSFATPASGCPDCTWAFKATFPTGTSDSSACDTLHWRYDDDSITGSRSFGYAEGYYGTGIIFMNDGSGWDYYWYEHYGQDITKSGNVWSADRTDTGSQYTYYYP